MAEPQTLFEELGGEPALRAIIDDFVGRVFGDMMIGFFFRKADRQRVKDKEYELAAALLGAPVEYTGRPIQAVHAVHPIMGGQFARRLSLLRETLEDAGAPPPVIERWIAHTESLRAQVTRDASGECVGPPPQRPRARALPLTAPPSSSGVKGKS